MEANGGRPRGESNENAIEVSAVRERTLKAFEMFMFIQRRDSALVDGYWEAFFLNSLLLSLCRTGLMGHGLVVLTMRLVGLPTTLQSQKRAESLERKRLYPVGISRKKLSNPVL